jgi:lactose/L-arabinose transport system permease protein
MMETLRGLLGSSEDGVSTDESQWESSRKQVWKTLVYIVITVGCIVTVFPLYWMIVAATLPQSEFLTYPPRLIPGTYFIENFRALQQSLPFIRNIFNSVVIAVIYTILSVFLTSLAGFAFAKYDFKYKRLLFLAILATLVLPIQIIVIPLFLLMSTIDWVNTFRAVILPWVAHPLGIFLMHQNMKNLPDSLLESARLDGATEFQIFYRIALPPMKPALLALAVILFMQSWNMFLYPLVVLTGERMYTIPVALAQITGGVQRVYYGQVMVAASLAIIPMFLFFILLQRHFVKGIMSGAVKQ